MKGKDWPDPEDVRINPATGVKYLSPYFDSNITDPRNRAICLELASRMDAEMMVSPTAHRDVPVPCSSRSGAHAACTPVSRPAATLARPPPRCARRHMQLYTRGTARVGTCARRRAARMPRPSSTTGAGAGARAESGHGFGVCALAPCRDNARAHTSATAVCARGSGTACAPTSSRQCMRTCVCRMTTNVNAGETPTRCPCNCGVGFGHASQVRKAVVSGLQGFVEKISGRRGRQPSGG